MKNVQSGDPKYEGVFNPKPIGERVNPHVREATVEKPIDYEALNRIVHGASSGKPNEDE